PSATPTAWCGTTPTPTPIISHSATPTTATTEASDSASIAPSTKTRGPYKKCSIVWTTLKQFVNDDGEKMAQCIYCDTFLAACSRKNGTSSLKVHVDACAKGRAEKDGQNVLNLQPSGNIEGGGMLTNWKFNQSEIRIALAEMIIIDELPFIFVEHQGFRRFMVFCCPMFIIPLGDQFERIASDYSLMVERS
ncbi:hypothetical protein LINGRAHAP2_LOCUS14170, partial [Linum grandiflorum]